MESQPGRDWTQIRLIRFSRTSVALGDLSPNPGDFSLWANSMVWPRGRRPVQAVSPCPVQTITKGPTGVPADRSQKAQDIRPGVSCCLPAMLLAQSGKSPPHDRFGRARITKERKNRMSPKSSAEDQAAAPFMPEIRLGPPRLYHAAGVEPKSGIFSGFRLTKNLGIRMIVTQRLSRRHVGILEWSGRQSGEVCHDR
jgi:hypothetical protein